MKSDYGPSEQFYREMQEVVMFLKDLADQEFDQLSAKTPNHEILAKTLAMGGLADFIVDKLEQIESGDGDMIDSAAYHELANKILSECERLAIPIPRQIKDKIRWLNLVSVGAAKLKGFAYGNVLIPTIDVERLTPERIKALLDNNETNHLLGLINPNLMSEAEIDKIIDY